MSTAAENLNTSHESVHAVDMALVAEMRRAIKAADVLLSALWPTHSADLDRELEEVRALLCHVLAKVPAAAV